MHVCVIGAGPAGLCTLKELLDEGHQVTCFEQGLEIGGAFACGSDKGVYDSTILTSSNYFMAFSSLPPLADEPRIQWTRHQYTNYLHRYAQTFELLPHIHFGTRVLEVLRRADGRLNVRVRGRDEEQAQQQREHTFDALAVCSGPFQLPYLPELPGREHFHGQILHADSYRNAEDFRGRRVVCIGLGETGADIVHEVSRVARECTLLVRRPPTVIPRYIRGHASDARASRALFSIPYRLRNAVYLRGKRSQLRKQKTRGAVEGLIHAWSTQLPDRYAQAPTKNEVFLQDVLAKRVRLLVGQLEGIKADRVGLRDGRSARADVLLCCTGYRDHFCSLGKALAIEHVRKLYKHMICPNLGPRVAFIGWARPSTGGIPACSEMQARYFALLCSGKRQLPPRAELERRIAAESAQEDADFFLTPHVKSLVVWGPYMDGLAELVGCRPPRWSADPRLSYKLLFGSQLAYQYRLRGPHAQPELARQTLLRLPVAYTVPEMMRISVEALVTNLQALLGSARR